jgi:hypothetical protein
MNLNGIKRSGKGVTGFSEDDRVSWNGKLGDVSAVAQSLDVVTPTLASVACLR